jgi:hypothetical protein
MSKYLLAHTPQAGPVNLEYSESGGIRFNWCLEHVKDYEKDAAILYLWDEGYIDKLTGNLNHSTTFEECIVHDLINSIKELEYK